MRTLRVAVPALAAALCGSVACKKAGPSPAETASAAPSAEARPVDHLGPGELATGHESAFGMPLPRGLRVLAMFPGVVEAAGPLTMEDVSNYLRAHVDAQRVELGAVGAVFPAVHIEGGDPAKVYRIQLSAVGSDTHVAFLDVTPKPPPPVEHLTNEEAWRRAGFKPDGTPLERGKLQ